MSKKLVAPGSHLDIPRSEIMTSSDEARATRQQYLSTEQVPSAMLDFIVNGGDDIKFAQAQAEHALGLLGSVIEERDELLRALGEIELAAKRDDRDLVLDICAAVLPKARDVSQRTEDE